MSKCSLSVPVRAVLFLKQFSVFGGGDTFVLLKESAEIQGVLISDNGRNFCHVVIGCLKETDRIIHAEA